MLKWIDRSRLEVEGKRNFLWIAPPYGFGFRLWVIEIQVYFYKPGPIE